MLKLKFQMQNKTKLGKIAHFSTMPYDTCAQKCTYCYALKSVRMYPSVKANYTLNTEALNNGARLPDVPKNRSVIRMYVSGDFQNKHTVLEWFRLAKENKDKIFYGYTKQWTNSYLLPYLTLLKNLDNIVLRASVDSQTGYDVPIGWTQAGILEHSRKKQGKYFVCKSNKKTGLKCEACEICFLPKFQNVPVYFPAH